eukprot:3519672-Alexandrium_andersonii.AAC.1
MERLSQQLHHELDSAMEEFVGHTVRAGRRPACAEDGGLQLSATRPSGSEGFGPCLLYTSPSPRD